MKIKHFANVFWVVIVFQTVNAQNITDSTQKPLVEYLQKGKISGLWRNFVMFTDNESTLMDFGTWATGLHLNYKTLPWKGFSASAGFSSVGSIWNYHLTQKDPQTNQPSRYEIGLYDMANPENHKAIVLMTELALQYQYKNWKSTFGKQLIKTPFINPQDGRMVPTLVEGLYIQKNEKSWSMELGYLYQIAPRGVSKWYTVARSIGVYPQGVQPNGKPSQYAGNIHSNGLGLIGLQTKLLKNLLIKTHDLWVDNVMNSILFQADWTHQDSSSKNLWSFSLQMIRQDGIGNGGNIDPSKQYFPKGGKSMTYGGQILWGLRNMSISFSYNRITSLGRFLLPREWGIEPFFTFLSRERSDGFADVHAYAMKSLFIPKNTLKISLQTAYVNLPDVKDFQKNKYGFPAYGQTNLEIKFSPNNFFKSLELVALLVYKHNLGETYGEKRYIINRTNMFQWNGIINYKF